MACKSVELDSEILSCPICLDLLTDPVTVPCGHNYCMDCIKVYWDSEGGKPGYVCPQCRRTFARRPKLLKNTTLAAVADELKKASLQDPADPVQAVERVSSLPRMVNFRGQDVRSAASERWQSLQKIADTLPKVFSEEMSKISQETSDTDGLGPQNEPRGRGDFLKYSRKITLDAETAHPQLQLSAGNTRAAFTGQSIHRPSHPGRFTNCCQVLGTEDVTGRAYWEVKWDGAVYVAVAYADVKRDGGWSESGFGFSDKSWALYCDKANYLFCHNSFTTPVLGPPSTTLGVYVDHSAGVLSFHSVGSETMTLLHRVHATFTQPLRAGFWLNFYPENNVEIVKL